jgi:hypothetical protein
MMAKWGLRTWLVFVRVVQIIGTLMSASLNGFLLVWIHVNRLGLTDDMFALEIMVCTITRRVSCHDHKLLSPSLTDLATLSCSRQTCIMLIYTASVLLLQHTGGRRGRRNNSRLVIAFVIGDVISTGLTVGISTMLARAGVPIHCGGLTRSDCEYLPLRTRCWMCPWLLMI